MAALEIPLLPSVLNRVWPRRFSQGEERALNAAREDGSIDPTLLLAGDVFRYHRQQAQAAARQLKLDSGERPLELPVLFGESMSLGDMEPLQAVLRGLVAHA